jgi:hypothetical protein
MRNAVALGKRNATEGQTGAHALTSWLLVNVHDQPSPGAIEDAAPVTQLRHHHVDRAFLTPIAAVHTCPAELPSAIVAGEVLHRRGRAIAALRATMRDCAMLSIAGREGRGSSAARTRPALRRRSAGTPRDVAVYVLQPVTVQAKSASDGATAPWQLSNVKLNSGCSGLIPAARE